MLPLQSTYGILEPFSDSPPVVTNPWLALYQLAERAGISVEYLCSTVEIAALHTDEGKSTSASFAAPLFGDALEEVAHILADGEFEVTIKEWREMEHPRDEHGRFANGSGGANVLEADDFTTRTPPYVDHAQALKELHRIHNQVSLLYPQLPSRWKGELRIKPKSELNAAGSKSWQCSISVAQEMFAEPARKVCVMIHESMHAVSPTTIGQYAKAPNWEEGVIEGAVRTHRDEILRQLGTKISQTYFEDRDRSHPYNKYVDALEDIRRALGVSDVKGFYDRLMNLPADKIEADLLEQSSQLSDREKAKFPRRFAIAKAILEDRFKP